jgi:hypothetical protein
VDADCNGGRCVDGACHPTTDLCIDGSQCAYPNAHCLEGKCAVSCGANADCRDGFLCDTMHGTCTIHENGCTITNDCGAATEVCVAGSCVPRSGPGGCADPNDVVVENGCVPKAAVASACATNGVQDTCAAGKICLDHSCWLSCDVPNQNACNVEPVLNLCKTLSVGGTTYNVCATTMTLGNQCNPPSDIACTSPVQPLCVDGFCQ